MFVGAVWRSRRRPWPSWATAADLITFLDQGIRPARTGIMQTLSDPALTGMSRNELRKLTERIATRQAAHAERLTHQRRGGPRQPGTHRGVFPQKMLRRRC